MNNNVKIAKELVGIAKSLTAEVEKQDVEYVLNKLSMGNQIASDYWGRICENIIDDVVQDIEETADPVDWSNDDVKLAVGRVLCKRLGIEY